MKKITIFCLLISKIFSNQFDCYDEISKAQTAEQINIIAQILNLEQRQINQSWQILQAEFLNAQQNSRVSPSEMFEYSRNAMNNKDINDIANNTLRFNERQNQRRANYQYKINELNLRSSNLKQRQIWLNGCINLHNQKVNEMSK